MKMKSEYRYVHPRIEVHEVQGFVPFCDFSDVEDEETPRSDDEEEVVVGPMGRWRNFDSLW